MEAGNRNAGNRSQFEELLQRSMEEGLREVLGESGLQMVLSIHPLDQLSKDPVAFHEAMTWIFMDSGAAIIEREIARKLLDRMGENPIGKNSSLRSFANPESHSKSSQSVSETEKRVLRQFLALASLPKVYPAEFEADASGDTIGASSIELTALRFASAFKKGR